MTAGTAGPDAAPPEPGTPRPAARVLLRDAFERLRIPPIPQRVALGVLLFVGAYIALVGVTTYALQLAAHFNFPVNISTTSLMYYGGATAILIAAAYAVRPYRAYGPVSIGRDVAKLLYLWLLYQASPLSVSIGGGSNGANVDIALGYALIVLVLMLVTLFSVASDAVTTYEDFSHPAERLYWTYPARPR